MMACFDNIPPECQLDLWAKVIVAKNIQLGVPIIGSYDGNGNPLPEEYCICSPNGDAISCIKCITSGKITTKEEFICTNKVRIYCEMDLWLFVHTINDDYFVYPLHKTYTQIIPLSEFLTSSGIPITPEQFKNDVDGSELIVKNIAMDYIDIGCTCVDPDTGQTCTKVNLIITADIADLLTKWDDVTVLGVVNCLTPY